MEATTTTISWPSGRANNYPGKCEHCGGRVGGGAGVLVKGTGGWEVYHYGPSECEVVKAVEAEREVHGGKPVEVGIYERPDGRIFRVVESEYGNLYAKEITIHDDDPEYVTVTFEYAPGAMSTLAADMLMTEKAAKEFGIRYGFCVNCATEITTPQSRVVGYGPTCAKNNGWWYPTKREAKEMLAELEAEGVLV